jgi:hypothetical protein
MAMNGLHKGFFDAVIKGDASRVAGILSTNPEAVTWRYNQNGLEQPVTMIAHDAVMLQLLLDHKADPDAADRIGDTRLIQCGDGSGTARLLLDYKADVDKPNNAGLTPLMRAAFNHAVDVVKVLIERGANPDLTDKDGKTAEAIAEERFFPDVAAMIHDYAGTRHKEDAVRESEHFHKGLDHKIQVARPLAMKNT